LEFLFISFSFEEEKEKLICLRRKWYSSCEERTKQHY